MTVYGLGSKLARKYMFYLLYYTETMDQKQLLFNYINKSFH